MRMEMVETGADAHSVMPGDRKSPPDKSAKKTLPHRQGKNVAIFSEEPSHEGSADGRERHQDGIRPMKQGKEQAGKE